MKLIKQSYEIWEQDVSGKPLRGIITSPETMHESLLQGIYKQIERAGRICYKSEDKITEDSAEKFVQRLVNSKHYAMLEHGTVYLKQDYDSEIDLYNGIWSHYNNNPYSTFVKIGEEAGAIIGGIRLCRGTIYVTTNYRVLVENGWIKDLEYLCTPTKHHLKRVTIHFTTCRQVTHELVRHRKMSFAMESTRYCNYSKNHFNGELTYILPTWLKSNPNEPKLLEDPQYLESFEHFKKALAECEFEYLYLVHSGWQPQQAATVLPNCLKSEIIVTGFEDDWRALFDLRVLGTTGAPHPQMIELMEPVYKEFVKRYGIAKD